jgi:hypothetical protein
MGHVHRLGRSCAIGLYQGNGSGPSTEGGIVVEQREEVGVVLQVGQLIQVRVDLYLYDELVRGHRSLNIQLDE